MPVHATAIIDDCAEIDPTADIGPYVVIRGPVRIGAGTIIDPFAMLMGDTEIGPQCHIHSHVSIGNVPQDRGFGGEHSSCSIGAGTIIREGATVHRGTGEGTRTVIGQNCFLMTNAHVGHNCRVGNNVTLISGSLLGGHAHIDDGAIISGNSAVHQFVHIGRLAMIAGVAPVTDDVIPFALTDHNGHVAGVNMIGMRRAGLPPEARDDVKRALRIIYRSTMRREQIAETLRNEPHSEAIDAVIEFLLRPSRRGLCKASPRLSAR